LDCFIEHRVAEELYDVVNDPYQLNNLAGDRRYAEALVEMREMLDNWMIEFDDQIPENPTPDKFNRWSGANLDE